MKKQTFILSALILAMGGFFAKAIGAFYKIPLANILGSSGMGIYYLIFPIYSLLITISSSGIAIALATEVAKCRKVRQKYNEQKLLRVALVITFLVSLIFTLLIIIFAKLIAEKQGNVNGYLGYIIISPAIIISSLIATLRGYFQGIENMIPTTVSMIIEQIVKLSVGLILAHALCSAGIEYAVIGAILGVTISEVVAFIIIAINFFAYKGQLHYNYKNLNYKKKKKIDVLPMTKNTQFYKLCKRTEKAYFKCNNVSYRYSTKDAIKKIMKVSIPAMFSNLIIPIATMLDSFMIINILVKSGYSTHLSTSLYGMWGGIVQSLISLPIIIIAGVSTALVPSLSGLIAKNDTNEIKEKVAFFIKLTWILAIIMFGLIFVFAEGILKFLYGDGLSTEVIDELFYATKMLKLSSVSIIYYAFLQTFTAILQAIGKSHIPFVALAISLIVRVALINILVSITNINIFGAIVANTIFLSVAAILCVWYIKKWIQLKYVLWRHLIQPLIIGLCVILVMRISEWALNSLTNYFFAMIISGVIGVGGFLIIVYFSRVFDIKELKLMRLTKSKITYKKDKKCKN